MMVNPVTSGVAHALAGSSMDGGNVARPNGAVSPSDPSQATGLEGLVRTGQTPGLGVYAQLMPSKERALETALAVREADARLARLREQQSALREATTAILKQYPPFPPESEDRQRYLRAITALRHQIDALTVPPPNDPTGALQRLSALRLPDVDPNASSDAVIAQLDAALSAMQADTDSLQTELRIWADMKAADTVRAPPSAEEKVHLSLSLGQALGPGRSLMLRHEALEALG